MLKVYYGIEKTNSIKHKRAICILFSNSNDFRMDKDGRSYQDRFVARQMHLAYTRPQTAAEAADALGCNTVFVGYSMFIDDRRYGGSLQKVLAANSAADKNNVSKAERQRIAEALHEIFMEVYPDYKEPVRQLQLNLFTNHN